MGAGARERAAVDDQVLLADRTTVGPALQDLAHFGRVGGEAARLVQALLEAAEAFASQLPEVFAGLARDPSDLPVEYADALKPQAWAAGTPLLGIRTLLGLDIVDGEPRCEPHLPEGIGELRLRGVHVRGREVNVPLGG